MPLLTDPDVAPAPRPPPEKVFSAFGEARLPLWALAPLPARASEAWLPCWALAPFPPPVDDDSSSGSTSTPGGVTGLSSSTGGLGGMGRGLHGTKFGSYLSWEST